MSRGGRVSDYHYTLPPGLIARHPTERRDESRLLVLPRGEGPIRHQRFRDILDFIRPGDLLVVNESRVLPARLLGRKATGAAAEILLLHPWRPEPGSAPESVPHAMSGSAPSAEGELWEALVRPGGKLKPGRRVTISSELEVEIVDSTAEGGRIVRLVTPLPVTEALDRYGHVPLPPYLEREDEPADRERYQTVYATVPGSVAAPTAGLHFTPELLAGVETRGGAIARITLHVGVGTFRPVEVDDPLEHPMHTELYSVSEESAELVNRTRAEGGRVWAVGTTTVRTLESAAIGKGRVRAGTGETKLFIFPPYDFQVVDVLVTNFHLPRSTLLMLVAAMGGYERTMEAYRAAIAEEYRFYSYGDALLLGAVPDRGSPPGSDHTG